MTDPDTSAAVCYRHPDRQSWTLCQRCGRTICPECQILTPQGVRCPTCVQELGGSVQWQPANAPAPRVRKVRATASRPRSRWQQTLIDMVRPGSGAPVVSWSILGVVLLLWIAGFVTANAPLAYLGAVPGTSWQLWRLFTSPLVYPAAVSAGLILGLVFNVVFFLITAPSIERAMGRGRFLVVFFAAGAIGSAGMLLAGQPGYGLTGPLFGLFGALLVAFWSTPAVRNQFLIILGINFVLTLAVGSYGLPQLVGGLIGGTGAALLFRTFDDRPRSRPSTPYLLIVLGVALFAVIAVVRELVA